MSVPETVRAIDPADCGCMECLTGEYMPWLLFTETATVEDVMRFIRGDLVDNTSQGRFPVQTIMRGLYEFSAEVQDWVESSLVEAVQANLELLTVWDVEQARAVNKQY